MARFVLLLPCMTQPRPVVPGDTLMITRRTLLRHHLFRPDPAIRQIYLYTLALCARQFGIMVHAVTLMSTHEHLIVTDPQGRYPKFLQRLHRLVSLGTKGLRKWGGPTWDHEQTSVVRLLTEQAVIEKLAYVMANPVQAGLVRHARDWPGIIVLPQALGRCTWRVERPDAYFDPKNPEWIDTAELSLTLPPALEQAYSPEALRDAVRIELERQERLAHQEVKRRGGRVLGAERVRRLSPYRRATSFFGAETPPSQSGGDRGSSSLQPWQSSERFDGLTGRRSTSGARGFVKRYSLRVPGACAGCTAWSFGASAHP